MRQIKFRGKRKDNSEWVFGDFLKPTDYHFCIRERISQVTHYVESETVGQFTGLTDKNGKEIYEGDEIEYDTIYDEFRMPGGTGYWEWQRTRDYVVYRVDGFCLDMDSMPLSGIIDITQDMQDDFPLPDEYESGIEIIGNIHEDEQ